MTETDCGTSTNAVSVFVPVAASAPTNPPSALTVTVFCAVPRARAKLTGWLGSARQHEVTRELREAGRRNAYLIVAGKQIDREGSTRGRDDGFLLIAAQEDDAGRGDRSTRGIGNGSLENVTVTSRVATGNPRLRGRRGGGYRRLRSRTNAVDKGKQRQGQSKSHARKDLAKGSGGFAKASGPFDLQVFEAADAQALYSEPVAGLRACRYGTLRGASPKVSREGFPGKMF
jgi:hypothetical protein